MNRLVMLFLGSILLSCGSVTEDELTLLNGYWEITEVEFPNGKKKEYKMNSNVDYFKVDNLKGYRKKVNPKFDGSFETSDDAEPFTIFKDDDTFKMRYNNNLSTWEENILSLSDENFSVKNGEGIVYRYKRFEPINLSD